MSDRKTRSHTTPATRKPRRKGFAITAFARSHGLSVEAMLGWIERGTLRAPIVIFKPNSVPRIDAIEWRKKFAI